MNKTESRAEAGAARWSPLVVCFAVWVTGLGWGLDGSWGLAVGTALVYVGMHVFEVRKRNRSFEKADATALPVSFLVFSASVVGLALAGHPPREGKDIALCWLAYLVVWILGHLAARACAAIVR
ncbi:MAG: hypothetical protein ACYTGN_08385 [Planctomycetota bacterium]